MHERLRRGLVNIPGHSMTFPEARKICGLRYRLTSTINYDGVQLHRIFWIDIKPGDVAVL